jgi:hypothetical protein
MEKPAATVSEPSPSQPPVKLTKKGVPRKPYVKTPAREAAFQKCREAKLAKLKEKREEEMKRVKDSAPEFSQEKFDNGTDKEKDLQIHALRKAKARLQAEKIVIAIEKQKQGGMSQNSRTNSHSEHEYDAYDEDDDEDDDEEDEEQEEEKTASQSVPMETVTAQTNENVPQKQNTEKQLQTQKEHLQQTSQKMETDVQEDEAILTSDSELNPDHARQVRKYMRRAIREKHKLENASKKKVRIQAPEKAGSSKVKKRVIIPAEEDEHKEDADEDDGSNIPWHYGQKSDDEEDGFYSYKPMRVPRQRPAFATFKPKPLKKMRTGYTEDQLEFLWL